jgi:outer membrane protein TolC
MVNRSKPKTLRSTCLLTGMLALTAALFQQALARPIGFQAAVSLALRTSPESTIRQAQVASARGRLTEAQGRRLPHLGLEWAAGRSNDPLTVLGYRLSEGRASFGDLGLGSYTGPSSLGTQPAALDNPDYADNFDTGIVLDVPLFASGTHAAEERGARALLDARKVHAGASTGLITFEVLRRYDAVHATHALFTAARQAVRAAQGDLRIAESLFRKGLVIRSDVLGARAHLAEDRAREEAARSRWQDALDSFRIALGLPASSRIVPGPAVEVSAPQGTLAQLRHTLLHDNPDLRSLRAQLRAQGSFLSATEDGRGPRLDLILRHDWNGRTPSFHAPSNTFLLELRWNLYTAGVESGAESAARAHRRKVGAELVQAQRQLERALIQSVRNVRVAEHEVRASQIAAHEARLAAHLVELRYSHGLGTLTQLLSAQARLERARSRLVLSRYRLVLGQAALRLTLNRLGPGTVISAPDDSGHPGD